MRAGRTARAAIAIIAAMLAATAAAMIPPEVVRELPGARMQGEGRLRWFGLAVYDARLWVAAPATADVDVTRQPLALELQYARALRGDKIAERSLEEMRRAGPIEAALAERWLQAMKRCFPDVRQGDRITGVHRPGEVTRFFHNTRLACEVADADFGPRFFAIWLAPTTSEPRLRASLLGIPR